MEITVGVVVFLVLTVLGLGFGAYASTVWRQDLQSGMIATEMARRAVAATRLARLLAIAGWDTWRYAETTPREAMVEQSNRCSACTHKGQCDKALACGNASAVIAFCPNAKAVRPLFPALAS